MTITRQQFIQELCAARETDLLPANHYAYAVNRAEELFGPDLRTLEGVRKWRDDHLIRDEWKGCTPEESEGYVVVPFESSVPANRFIEALEAAGIPYVDSDDGAWEMAARIITIAKERK